MIESPVYDLILQEGIERGIEQGIEQGSYNARCQTAKAMIRAGKLDLSDISVYTDLTIEDIERLSKEV